MSLESFTQSAKHFTFLNMPKAHFLLFSFEDAGMYPKYSAEKIFIGEAESAKS